MNTQFTYFVLLAASIAGPLALSFDKKVSFYKSWKYLFPSLLIPALFYIAWDIYFTSTGIWSFNEKYIIGIKLVNLPVEEVLFFFVVPYCCLFIYECVRCYFPKLIGKRNAVVVLQLMGFILLIAGLFFYEENYTCWTFIFCALFIAILYLSDLFKTFDASIFLVSFAIVLIPFLIINGFLTAIPVVLYNNRENTGIRIYTIPFEDVFYGMLLMMMEIAFYEKARARMLNGKGYSKF